MELTHDCALDILLYLESEFEEKNIIYSLQIAKNLDVYSESHIADSISRLLYNGYIVAIESDTLTLPFYSITDITDSGYTFIRNHKSKTLNNQY